MGHACMHACISVFGKKVKFTCATPMSQSRVGTDDAMVVDEARVDPPTNEWLEAAQRATDTDGILENASVKRQKVCISMAFHATRSQALHLQPMHKNAHKRESLSRKHEGKWPREVAPGRLVIRWGPIGSIGRAGLSTSTVGPRQWDYSG